MIAQIVPILRLRRDTTWWSYKVPVRSSVQPGSLVVAPFRGRPTLGIVWSLDEREEKATEEIAEVLCKRPLVTAPHRALIEYMSEQGLCSLPTALYTWLPDGLRGFPLTKPTRKLLADFEASLPDLTRRQHAILAPGERPFQEALLAQKFGGGFASLFGPDLEQWFAIAQGDIQVGMGRERCLFAPWSNLRQVTLIEPEDISYYHEQIPYLSLVPLARKAAESSNADLQVKSWLPETAAESLWPAADGSDPGLASIRDLRRSSLINPELLAECAETLEQGRQIVLLLNAHDRRKQSGGELKVIPGIETIKKRLAYQLNHPNAEPDVIVGTRSVLQGDLARVGKAVVLLADIALDAGTFADSLHAISDICHLLSLGVPVTLQTYQPEHPLIAAFQQGKVAEYLGESIKTQEEAGMPPFGSIIACSYAGEDIAEAQEAFSKMSVLCESPWTLSEPLLHPWRKKPFVHLLLRAPRDARIPIQLRRFLVQLPHPWRIQRNPWYLA